jgi:hypothetical protein
LFLRGTAGIALSMHCGSSNQSLQLPGRPSRGGAWSARGAAFGGTVLALGVSSACRRAAAAGGSQLSSIRYAAKPGVIGVRHTIQARTPDRTLRRDDGSCVLPDRLHLLDHHST